MINTKINAGICGFITTIEAECTDGQNVTLNIVSDCPSVAKAASQLKTVDAYANLFVKPVFSGPVYTILGDTLPHATCPVPSGLLKAVEAAAQLALKKEAVIEFED